MSKMADLDIVLTDYKLSDAQKNAVVELLDGGATVAKTVTFKALERKGLVTKVDDFWQLTAEFKAELVGSRGDNFTEVLGWEPDTREGVAWDASVITEDEIDIFKDMADKLSGVEDEDSILSPDTFTTDWSMRERELMGFGATIGWSNTRAWEGLTAQEIREDMDTALPIGRKARRERTQLMRKALAAV